MSDDATICADLVAERAILSACLDDAGCWDAARSTLAHDDFYDARHAAAWRAMTAIADRKEPLDLVSLHQQLERDGYGERVGIPYLVALLQYPAAFLSLAANCRRIAEFGLVRRLADTMHRLSMDAHAPSTYDDPSAWLDKARAMGAEFVVARQNGHTTMLTSVESARLYRQNMNAARRGVLFGITRLDEATGGGMLPGEVTVIGARTQVGKTTIAMQYAEKAQRLGFRVGYFCGEMPPVALQQRYVSAHAGIPLHGLRRRQLAPREEIAESEWIADWELLGIKVKSGMFPISTLVRECSLNPEIDFVIIDYLQRFGPPEGRRYTQREQEVAAVARAVTELAVRRNVAVLALVQLNKDAIGKLPNMGDIRESDVICQEATTVLLLQRDAHSTDKYKVQCVLDKNRNGDAGTMDLWFDKSAWTLQESPNGL